MVTVKRFSYLYLAMLVCVSVVNAHEWETETDHFHQQRIERALSTFESLAQSRQLRMDPAMIPEYARNLAFGFAMALGAWDGPGADAGVSANAVARATEDLEVLAVLIDAASQDLSGVTTETLSAQSNRLGTNAAPSAYFQIAYRLRMLAVDAADRTAARAYIDRFESLRKAALKP